MNYQANENYFRQLEVLRTTLEAIDDFIFILDKDGKFSELLSYDDNFNLWGFTSTFKVGSTLLEAGFPEEVDRMFQDAISKIKKQGTSELMKYSLEAFGSILYYQAKMSPRFTPDSAFDGVTVVARDITQSVKSEQKLKESLDYYLKVLDNFPTLIWRTNTKGKIDYLNKTWLDFTGKSADQELAGGWIENLHPDESQQLMEQFTHEVKARKSFFLEYRLLHKAGEYRWIRNFCEPLLDYKGRFSGYIGSCFDIDDFRKTQELLKDSENRFRELFDSVPDIVFVIDEKWVIKNINQAMTNILGYPDSLGMRLWDVLAGTERQIVSRKMKRIILNHIDAFSFETQTLCANGETKFLQVKGHIKYNDRKLPVELFGIARDITKQRMLEKRIFKTSIITQERERRRFAEEINDGIGPLLSGLKMYLQQKGFEKNLQDQQLRVLSYCRELVDDAISQTRIIARNLTPGVLNELGLEKALTGEIERLNARGETDISIKIKQAANEIDPDTALTIFRVISELTDNTLKHAQASVAEIVLDVKEANIVLFYSDNGIGFNISEFAKKQSDKMGMYNIHHRISALNGKVFFESSEGKGFYFKALIPIR